MVIINILILLIKLYMKYTSTYTSTQSHMELNKYTQTFFKYFQQAVEIICSNSLTHKAQRAKM